MAVAVEGAYADKGLEGAFPAKSPHTMDTGVGLAVFCCPHWGT